MVVTHYLRMKTIIIVSIFCRLLSWYCDDNTPMKCYSMPIYSGGHMADFFYQTYDGKIIVSDL